MTEWFPNRSITEDEVDYLKVLWGGEPFEDPSEIAGFIHYNADPLLQSSSLDVFLPRIAASTADVLDVDGAVGARVFTQGAKLYAGIIAVITPLDRVSFNENIIRKLGNIDERAFTWRMHEKISEEAASFCDVVSDLRPALETAEDEKLHSLSLIGGGFMHAVIKGELRRRQIAEMEAEFSELSDLEALFKDLQ